MGMHLLQLCRGLAWQPVPSCLLAPFKLRH
jgi:hypothetical protein